MGSERASAPRWLYAYVPHGIAGGATSALIPLFAFGLGGSLATVGIIAAATSVSSVPAFILWGTLSDRFGRRRTFLLVGFLGNAACYGLMALSHTIYEFLLANLLNGFLTAAIAPAGTALLMETSRKAEWPARLASASLVGAVGWVSGLGVGAAWLALGPPVTGTDLAAMRTLFTFSAGVGTAASVPLALWAPEAVERIDRRDVQLVVVRPRVERGRYLPMWLLQYLDLKAWRSPEIRLAPALRAYLVSVFLFFAGFTAFYGFFPIFLSQAYRLTNPEIFAVYVASQLMAVIVYPAVGRIVGHRDGALIQVRASAARALLFGGFFLAAMVPTSGTGLFAVAIALHAGIGFCWAFLNVAGSTLVSRLAPPEGRAYALGAYNAVQGFGAIFGPLVGGLSAEWLGYGPAFAVAVGLVLFGSGLLALILPRAAAPPGENGISRDEMASAGSSR